MSTAVYVYSVPVDQLRAAPGSKDEELLDAALDLEGFFETIDEIAENFDDDDERGRPPECAAAYRQIVNGEPYADDFGYVYGYAYEGLCMALGAETERSWTQIARSYDWFREIDAALAALGVGLKVTDLVGRGALIDIPTPDDFPALGWWTADEVAAAATAFEVVDLDRVDGKTKKVVGRVSEAVEDIRSWIAVASGRPGDWLIGVQS
jgi:hypothetical protein